MFKVYHTDQFGVCHGYESQDLSLALAYAEHLRRDGERFVVMCQENPNQVGRMGVDSVKEGILPDGTEYTWRKRR